MALEPITRQEKIIAGQDLIPITRMEKFLKNFGGGGGGSVPKPLTYDYMPEGYPTKSVQTTTLMDEQELAFTAAGSLYFAALPSLLDIIGGQTYTVKWDGTEHECVCSIFNGKVLALGNPSIIGMGSDTGEPFCYASVEGGFMTLDTSASHTISVKRIEETVTPMAEEFLPNTAASFIVVVYNANTAGTAHRADKTYDEISTAINSGQNVVVHKKESKNAANYSVYYYTGNAGGIYSFCNVNYYARTYRLEEIRMFETNGELSIEVAPALELPIATST